MKQFILWCFSLALVSQSFGQFPNKFETLEAGDFNKTLYVTGSPFFAVGDGVADDDAAFQRAADSTGRIFVPEGTYLVDSVYIQSFTVWEGMGENSIIKLRDATDTHVFWLASGATDITFRNLTIDGNRANQTSTLVNCIYGADNERITFENVIFKNASRRGIYLDDSTGSNTVPKSIKILNCKFYDMGKSAFTLVESEDAIITGCTLKNWGAVTAANPGIGLQEFSEAVIIEHNTFINESGNQFAIEVTTPGDTAVGLSKSIISKNIFWDVNALGGNGISGFISSTTMSGNIHLNGIGTHRSGYEIVGVGNSIENNFIENGSIHVNNGTSPVSGTDISGQRNKIHDNTIILNGIANTKGIGIGGVPATETMTDISIKNNHVYMFGVTGSSNAIWLGFVGTTGKIQRVEVHGNHLFADNNIPNGIRLLALAGSSNINIEFNEAHGFNNGFTVDATANYDEVDIKYNDFANNTTPLNDVSTGGDFRKWGNVLFDGEDFFRVPKISGSRDASGDLRLQSTSHATKGKILLGDSYYDEALNRLIFGASGGADVNLYRSAPDVLKTDDAFVVAGVTTSNAGVSVGVGQFVKLFTQDWATLDGSNVVRISTGSGGLAFMNSARTVDRGFVSDVGDWSFGRQTFAIRFYANLGTSGTIPTLEAGEEFLFQNNVNTTDNTKVTILAGNIGVSAVNFADAQNNNPGAIEYDHSGNELSFLTAGAIRVSLESDGDYGHGIVNPAVFFHERFGASGPVPTFDVGEEFLFQSNVTTTDNAKVAILAGNLGISAVDFADENNNNPGAVEYNHNGNIMSFVTAGSSRMTVDANGVNIGSGTAIAKYVVYSQSLDVTSKAANTTGEQTFTVTGLATSDKVFVNKPSHTVGLGIMNVRVSATNTLAITFGNLTGAAIDPAAETYEIVAIRN